MDCEICSVDKEPLIFEMYQDSESVDTLKPKTSEKCQTIWFGVGLATLSGLLFTVNNIIFKNFDLDHVDTMLLRSLVQVIITTILCFYWKMQFCYYYKSMKVQCMTILQGLASALVLLCCYQCLHYLPLGDAMTLIFSSPLFTGKINMI